MSVNAAAKGPSQSMARPMILPKPPPVKTMPPVLDLISLLSATHPPPAKCSHSMPVVSSKCTKHRVTESITAVTPHIHPMDRVSKCKGSSSKNLQALLTSTDIMTVPKVTPWLRKSRRLACWLCFPFSSDARMISTICS